MNFPNYYSILQLEQNATEEQIWLNYHRLAFLEKRRKNADLLRLLWLLEAYESLKNPEIRKEYDKIFKRYYHFAIPYNLRASLVVFLTGFFSEVIFFILTHLPKAL